MQTQELIHGYLYPTATHYLITALAELESSDIDDVSEALAISSFKSVSMCLEIRVMTAAEQRDWDSVCKLAYCNTLGFGSF